MEICLSLKFLLKFFLLTILELAFWFLNCVAHRFAHFFRCIVLFVFVVIICLVQATASCGFVSYLLSSLFRFCFPSRKEYGTLSPASSVRICNIFMTALSNSQFSLVFNIMPIQFHLFLWFLCDSEETGFWCRICSVPVCNVTRETNIPDWCPFDLGCCL